MAKESQSHQHEHEHHEHEHHHDHDHHDHHHHDQPHEKKTATNTAFKEYKKLLLDNDIPQAKNSMETTLTDYYAKRLTRWKKKAVLVKAEETLDFYQALSDNIGVFARKDASEIKKKIDITADASTKNVTAKLTEAFKTLKEAKDKLKIVRTKADELHNALTDSVYSDDVSELSKKFKDTTPEMKSDNAKNFSEAIAGLKTVATGCFNLSDDSVEVAIKVSGIHATTNVSSMTELGKKVADSVALLQTQLEGNITYSEGNRKSARVEYVKAMEALAEAKFARYAATLNYEGVLDTTSQADNPECVEHSQSNIAAQLHRYAEAVECNFDKIINALTQAAT